MLYGHRLQHFQTRPPSFLRLPLKRLDDCFADMVFSRAESLSENGTRPLEELGTEQSGLSSPAQALGVPITATHTTSINILVAEHNQVVRKFIARQMDGLGHNCVYDFACNGQEAFEAYKKGYQTYQCILMQPSMPVIDGLHATRLIRAFEIENGLKPCYIVVMAAGISMRLDMDRTRSLGFDTLIQKPFKTEGLERLLVELGLVPKGPMDSFQD
ncbi:response regulator receiver protein [Colletotrichum filicis]|nr:response regulator receiver protein [Colletotrichum filicis]